MAAQRILPCGHRMHAECYVEFRRKCRGVLDYTPNLDLVQDLPCPLCRRTERHTLAAHCSSGLVLTAMKMQEHGHVANYATIERYLDAARDGQTRQERI